MPGSPAATIAGENGFGRLAVSVGGLGDQRVELLDDDSDQLSGCHGFNDFCHF